MKKFLLTIGFLFALATVGNAQSQCVDVEEIDGSPRAPCIRELKVTNGTLSCPTINRCVLTISGGGGGSPGWSAIIDPVTNLSLAMAATTTSFVWGATTGSSNLFSLADTTGNTGTGYVFSVNTAASSSCASKIPT